MPFTRVDIPLGQLDVSEPDHEAPASTLRAIMNLRPAGAEERPYWTPVEGHLVRGYLEDVLALGMQVRQRLGSLADTAGDPNQSLERQIRITDTDIYLADPNAQWEHKSVHTFAAADTTRKAQFAAIGDDTFIAVSSGAGVGAPEHLFLLRDDVVLDFDLPRLPNIAITATAVDDPQGLEGAEYVFRWAWLLKDGTYGPASHPIAFRPVTDGAHTDPTAHLHFEIALYPEAIPDDWEELIAGIAILLSPPLATSWPGGEKLVALFEQPVYHVETITTFDAVGATTAIDLAIRSEEIISFEQYDDQHLTTHQITAAAAFSYNKRLILGDVAYDFMAPDALQLLGDDPTGGHNGTRAGDFFVRIGVEIETTSGTINRIGAAAGVDTADATALGLAGYRSIGFGGDSWTISFLHYPDRRARRMHVYTSVDDVTYTLHSSYDLAPATNANLAVSKNIGPIDITTGAIGTAMPDPDVENAVIDHDVNRMLTSGTFRPFEMKAEGVLYVGAGPFDGVIGFAVNALPISQGQFGDYPMLVLCSETVSALTPGAATAWSRNEITARKGCVGRYAFTNVEQVVVFASRDGVWTLSPELGREPISRPLHNNLTVDDFYSCLGFDVALGYLNDPARGRRELWLSTDEICYGWGLPYQKWFLLDRGRRAFMTHGGRLYGVGSTLRLTYDEAAEHRLMSYFVRTTRQYLGAVGYRKRLRRAWIRQRHQMNLLHWTITDFNRDSSTFPVRTGIMVPGDRDVANIPGGVIWEPFLDIVGEGYPGQALLSIGFEYEMRTTHRPPETVPNTDVIPPWTCEEIIVPVLPPPDPPDGPGPDVPPPDVEEEEEEGGILAVFLTENRRADTITGDDIWNIYRYDVGEDTLLTLRAGTTDDDAMEMHGIAYRAADNKVYRYQSKGALFEGQPATGARINRTDVDGANLELTNPNNGVIGDGPANTTNRDFALDEDDEVAYIPHGGDIIRAPIEGTEDDLIDGSVSAYRGIFYDGSRYIYAANQDVTGEIWRYDKDTETLPFDGTWHYFEEVRLTDELPDDVWGLTSDGTYLYAITDDEKIYRVDLDGSNVTLLLSGTKEDCVNMAHHGGHLYWVANDLVGKQGFIRRCDVNGGNLETLRTIVGGPGAYNGLRGIDVALIGLTSPTTDDVWLTASGEDVVTHTGDTVILA